MCIRIYKVYEGCFLGASLRQAYDYWQNQPCLFSLLLHYCCAIVRLLLCYVALLLRYCSATVALCCAIVGLLLRYCCAMLHYCCAIVVLCCPIVALLLRYPPKQCGALRPKKGPELPLERRVRGAQPPGKRKKRCIYISIYTYII